MIQASETLLNRPDIPVTYVYASGIKVPMFEPFLRRLEADPRVDTHVVTSSHVPMLTAPNEAFEILENVRMTPTGRRTAA